MNKWKVQQNVRKYKEEPNTKRTQWQITWYIGISQWTGIHNSGNHLRWTDKKERSLKNEDSLRDFWNNIKFTNIHTIGAPDKRKNGKKLFEEIITENFRNVPLLNHFKIIMIDLLHININNFMYIILF